MLEGSFLQNRKTKLEQEQVVSYAVLQGSVAEIHAVKHPSIGPCHKSVISHEHLVLLSLGPGTSSSKPLLCTYAPERSNKWGLPILSISPASLML